ncbi:four and a half LIM domains protein 2-like [Centruroides sculpturatus]|uniref:four and a half LIM domains protein 2-like n=1 Tax=Centruroides sculpturatus TaxID=218467 RepID=UPI000C6DFA06|nr:four and a half LIM domains protein 2-like [Centruroides sculpturatus]
MEKRDYKLSDILIQEVDEGQSCLKCGSKCPSFKPHPWRNICDNCKCLQECHDICNKYMVNVQERIGLKGQHEQDQMLLKRTAIEQGYSWIPSRLSPDEIQSYFAQIPPQKVPRLGTPGEKYREKQIIVQHPKQDLDSEFCKFLEKECQQHYSDFINERKKSAMSIAHVESVLEHTSCYGCRGTIMLTDLAVVNSKLGEKHLFHPGCFVCSVCEELLVDLVCCALGGKIYCERHYAEQIRPRCIACDELIFSGEYIRAMSRNWHTIHFCCWKCDENLTGQQYIPRDDNPFCIRCYEKLYSNICEKCGKAIEVDSKDLSIKNKHWHEACFLCNECHTSLINKPFGINANQVYCAKCYEVSYATRCVKCGEKFKAGTRKMEYKDKQWHENCFYCVVCTNPIGTKNFIPKDNDIYCMTCYERKFTIYCIKCNQVISVSGVTFRNEHWHRECFCCTNCQTYLAGQRFTSRNEEPYCAECFGELFAKKCTACKTPITSICGARFITFEDRNWHNDCFVCATCKVSLTGRGFFINGDDILCPKCAN